MFIVLCRDLDSGQSVPLGDLFAEDSQRAVEQFTDFIKTMLAYEHMEEVSHRQTPRAGYYNELGQALLYDDETITSFTYDNKYYYYLETEDETAEIEDDQV